MRNPEYNRDWMLELEHDAQQVQAVISRLDHLALKAIESITTRNAVDAGIRLTEIREGLRLLCELMGVKLQG
jgi:hypothetical protein